MRQAGTLESEAQAQVFSDYLLSQGIENRVDQGDEGGFAVWIVEDEALQRAKDLLAAFRLDPTLPKYHQARVEAVRLRAAQSAEAAKARANYIDVRRQWQRPALRRRPVVTFLIVTCVLVGIVTSLGRRLDVVEWFLIDRFVGQDFSDIRHGQLWRLISPIFVHFGLMHILFNMFWLYELGSLIETRRSGGFLLAFIVFVGVASNVGQYLLAGPGFGGMSGVIYGLFGYAWLKGRYQPHLGIGVSQNTVIVMLVWFVVCLLGLVGPVANGAHAFGLLAGCLLGGASHWLRRME